MNEEGVGRVCNGQMGIVFKEPRGKGVGLIIIWMGIKVCERETFLVK